MFRFCLSAIIVMTWLSTAAAQTPVAPEAKDNGAISEVQFVSPRLAALANELKAGNRTALDVFWQELKDKAPLVETIPGDEKNLWVSFISRGDKDTWRVELRGGLPSSIEGLKPLTRLLDTDLWYLTESLPNDSRVSYTFYVNRINPSRGAKDMIQKTGKAKRGDPFNQRTFMGSNIIELPAAPPQPWIKQLPDVAQGEVKSHRIRSEILKEERTISVYTPPGYDPKSKPYGLLIFLDGEVVPFVMPLPTILDNLIAKEKIMPMIAVAVNSQRTRERDLTCSAPFADFLAKELVTWVRGAYNVSADPGQTVVSGVSLGGLTAAYCGPRHPGIFGNVLSQSGSFFYFEGWKPVYDPAELNFFVDSGWLTRQFATAPRLPLRFFLEVGRMEQAIPINQVIENRRLHDVLIAKGYPVTYSEYNGGHDPLCWRGSVADGLIALVGKKKEK
jgi:enterochelin esterase-like enzyme